MTNKKFKLAAMSLALTACVAASPLAANAEAVPETEPSVTATSGENAPTTNEAKPDTTNESNQDNNESKQDNEESKQDNEESKQDNHESNQDNHESKQDNHESNQDNHESNQDNDESKQDNEESNQDNNESNQDNNESNQDNNESNQDNDESDQNNDESDQNNDESDQNNDESNQDTDDEINPDAAVENNDLAAAPVTKAPMRMAVSLAAAPAAPTTPTEENTAAEDVAILNGQVYKSFDEAVSNANNGDTIEVINNAKTTGIDLRDKNLTIKGKTVTTTTDSGTEEKTTVKPQLKFVAKEGQSKIAGITLWGSNLTFQNMDVDMTGASFTTYNDWNAICMSDNAVLTLNKTNLLLEGKDLPADKQGIYAAGRGRSELNVNDHSTLTINNYLNAFAWDGVKKGNEGSTYFINITGGSTFTAEGNGGGIIGKESLDVLVDNSTLTVTNCTERSGFNGADVKIVNGSTANISGNHEGYGIHANDLLVENSTLTANDNGYGSIRITGKGEFTNSTVTVSGTENKGNASVEIACGIANETGTGPLNGSLSVQNSTLNISDNNASGIACRTSKSGKFHSSLTIDDASRVTIQNNNATPKNGYNPKGDSTGGGLRIEDGSTAVLGRNTVINNNHADTAGDDIVIQPGGTLTFSAGNAGIGDILKDCGDGIDGWYIDAEGQRWNFHGDPSVAQKLLDSKDVALEYNSDGTYTITAGREGLALKAAHAELPAPTPEPDPDPNPTPNPEPKPDPKPGPDTPVTPEDPQLPPVQDARVDTPDSPGLPANPTNPAVRDAHALPQTGTSLFAALAMAHSGLALTIAGAWASLLGKNSRH